MLKLPEFKTKKEKIDFLVAEKESLIAQKCSTIKFADGFGAHTVVLDSFKNNAFKSESASEQDSTDIQVKVVINTTGIMDSHSDVHIKGLWNKSLKENKRIMHVQEHKSNQFDKIISSGDDLKAFVKDYSWKDLGYNAEGKTEALVFDSTVKKERNAEMYNAYKQGWVDNHSVGMRYIKLELAVDDDEYEKEKDFWDKHIVDVVNKEDAENQGYFWVVTEAKVLEGSAVPNGSNPVTPTIKNNNEDPAKEVSKKELQAYKDFLLS